MGDTQKNEKFHDQIMVGGVIFNNKGEYLLVRERDKDGQQYFTFPSGPVENLPGAAWEVLEQNLSRNIFSQTGIEIADGLIPFTDQEFYGKDGFEQIMVFFIGRYKSGQEVISDPYTITEIVWKSFADFKESEFKPAVYQVFAKADQFIKKLESN